MFTRSGNDRSASSSESLKELVIKKCRNELTIYVHRKNQSKFHKIGFGVNLHYKFNSSFPTKRLN